MPTTANKIALKVNGRFGDGEADATISPGMAIQRASDGLWDPWQGATGEMGETVIAIEDALQGNTITDDYSDGDQVFYCEPLPGDECAILVKSGENIVIGDKLVKETATGLFIKTTGDPEDECFAALESSGGALAANDHIRCKRI